MPASEGHLDQLESKIRRAEAPPESNVGRAETPPDVYRAFRKCKVKHLLSMRALEDLAQRSLQDSDSGKLAELVSEVELAELSEQGVVWSRAYYPIIRAQIVSILKR